VKAKIIRCTKDSGSRAVASGSESSRSAVLTISNMRRGGVARVWVTLDTRILCASRRQQSSQTLLNPAAEDPKR
jgi:hypothetical protein